MRYTLISRRVFSIAIAFGIIGFAILVKKYDYEKVWSFWNIPVMHPYFADLRSVLSSVESYAHGLDPMQINPFDPWGRKLNYPRIWVYFLFALGLTQQSTTLVAILIILLWLFGLWLVFPDIKPKWALFILGAIFSPATLLGVERANTDLLIFFLIALGIAAVGYHAGGALVALLLATFLKIFPLFASPILLKVNNSKKIFSVFTVFALLYLFLQLPDLRLMSSNTPKSVNLSYGLLVTTSKLYGWGLPLWLIFLILLFLFLLLISGMFAALKENLFLEDAHPIHISGFLAATGVYVGTFLFTLVNYDYRLTFLIPAFPLLLRLSERGNFVARVTLGCIYTLLWELLLQKFLFQIPGGEFLSSVINEIASWIVLIGMSYLFFASMNIQTKTKLQKMLKISG